MIEKNKRTGTEDGKKPTTLMGNIQPKRKWFISN